jgi:hypothetical protein
MTTEAAVNPRILKAADDLTRRLVALEHEPDEIVLSARIVVRNGIPRKVKWTREDEECYS